MLPSSAWPAPERPGQSVLLDAPVDQLLGAQHAVSNARPRAALAVRGAAARPAPLPFQPVVDGDRAARPPVDAVAAGSAAGIPLITGTTRRSGGCSTSMSQRQVDDDRLRRADRTGCSATEAGTRMVDIYRRHRTGAVADDM